MLSKIPTSLMDIEQLKTAYPYIPEITLIRTSLIEIFHKFAKNIDLPRHDFLLVKRNLFRIFKLSYYHKDIPAEKVASISRKLLLFREELKLCYNFRVETVFQHLHHLSHTPGREGIDALTTTPQTKEAISLAIDDYCLQLKQFASVALLYLQEEKKSALKDLLFLLSKFKSPKEFLLGKSEHSEEFANRVYVFNSALAINKIVVALLHDASKKKLIQLNKTFIAPIQTVTRDLLLKYQEIRMREPS
ncbi:MAG: hypothetical protein FJZ59_00695 [Chlamydiae bacterium]|nr:hypothetical protein [Chlamydiota bacterium]